MTTYAVKLVDHRSSDQHELASVLSSIQRVFGLAFVGTDDGVSVSWGAGAASDNLVIHFVEDIAHSFLRTRFKDAKIDPNAGGHTTTTATGDLACTELYRVTPTRKLPLRRYGALAFHEALHNLFPARGDQHTAMGMGIASANIPDEDPNDENKAWLRKGFAHRNPQYY